MEELNKSINKRFKIVLVTFLSLILMFVNLSPALAAYMDQETEFNKREHQLLKKIKIIHELFPTQTDEAALYATVTHRGYLTDYVYDSYDSDFDENEFEEQWGKFKGNVDSIPHEPGEIVTSGLIAVQDFIALFIDIMGGVVGCLANSLQGQENPTITDEEGNYIPSAFKLDCVFEKVIEHEIGDNPQHTAEQNVREVSEVKTPKSVDLLTAATIVMIDSSGWFGNYSDENYQKALAGTGLVGNMTDDNVVLKYFSAVFNGLFCTAGAAADLITDGAVVKFADGDTKTTGFDPTDGFGHYAEMGSVDDKTSKKDRLSRYYTMARICSKGYIGGIYESVQNLENEKYSNHELYQPKKDKVAEEIIGLAKELRAKQSNDNCIVNSNGGGTTVWKQADEQWADVSVGDSNVGTIGCLITSIAMQMSRSGTLLTNLDTFNPGTFAEELNKNGGFTPDGQFNWTGHQNIAANWNMGSAFTANISDSAELAKVISEVLSKPAGEQYQPYVVLQIQHNNSNEHWVAVDGVSNGQVTILDPGGPTGNTLDENYQGWVVKSYRVMYATDVLFGNSGTGSAGSLGNTGTANSPATGTHFGNTTTAELNYCGGGTGTGDFADFIAYVEGTTKCNYRGQGEGTGYAAMDEGDNAGVTTGLGITEYYDKDAADQVGYTDFISDLHNGCTSKELTDKMYPVVMKKFTDYVDKNGADLNLTPYERDMLASVAYGGYNLFENVADKIRKYGKDSFEVFDCMKSNGCGFNTSSVFWDGLVRRRMAEYEVFRTGNYNVGKPTETYSYFAGITDKAGMDNYIATHWPTPRD